MFSRLALVSELLKEWETLLLSVEEAAPPGNKVEADFFFLSLSSISWRERTPSRQQHHCALWPILFLEQILLLLVGLSPQSTLACLQQDQAV